MKHLIYSPQSNATPDEVLQVLKVFTVCTLPPSYSWMDKNENRECRRGDLMFQVYDTLPPEAKRHFKVKEDK